MKIIIINKARLEEYPPTINIIKLLQKKDIRITIICSSCSDKLKRMVGNKQVNIIETNHKINFKGKMGKLQDWYLFNKIAWENIEKEFEKESRLWVATGDTALCLGKRLLDYSFYLSILELYDTNKVYLKYLRKYAINAEKVIVPEYCRGQMFKVWWKLKSNPVVLPNKPVDLGNAASNLDIDQLMENYALDKQSKLRDNSKIILYQGHINKDRDVTTITKALQKINNKNYKLVLLGKDHNETVKELKNIYSEVIHINFIEPPFHLQITKQADLGIATYDDSCLNNIFCAPNKIYEYTKFGVPVLCRDIPGLRYTIGAAKAGVCTDTNDCIQIEQAIRKIFNEHELYSKNAKLYHDSIDMQKIMEQILN